MTKFRTLPLEKKLSDLKIVEKKYAQTTTPNLQKLTKDAEEKIAILKNIRFTSNVTAFFLNISQSLSDGVWLNDLQIDYQDEFIEDQEKTSSSSKKSSEKTATAKKTTIQTVLTGYAYDAHLEEQISLIEGFLAKLKINPFLKKDLKKMDLEKVQKDEQNKIPITSFRINIETDVPHE